VTGSAVLAGFVVGAASGVLALELPPLGWMLGTAFLIGALGSQRRSAAIAGLLMGFGVAWIVVLWLAHQACVDFNVPPSQECIEPDVTAWFVFAIGMVSAGLVLLAVLAIRRRRHL
jgi:hypothetical protein